MWRWLNGSNDQDVFVNIRIRMEGVAGSLFIFMEMEVFLQRPRRSPEWCKGIIKPMREIRSDIFKVSIEPVKTFAPGSSEKVHSSRQNDLKTRGWHRRNEFRVTGSNEESMTRGSDLGKIDGIFGHRGILLEVLSLSPRIVQKVQTGKPSRVKISSGKVRGKAFQLFFSREIIWQPDLPSTPLRE